MGNNRLNLESAVMNLGLKQGKYIDMSCCHLKTIAATQAQLSAFGFAPLKQVGNYFYTSTHADNPDGEHIGKMRISFVYYPCKEASVIAQHVVDDNGEFAFRPYNPKMVFAPWGSDNGKVNEM